MNDQQASRTFLQCIVESRGPKGSAWLCWETWIWRRYSMVWTPNHKTEMGLTMYGHFKCRPHAEGSVRVVSQHPHSSLFEVGAVTDRVEN